MDRRAFVVVDLGFGDAGKGVVTDALVRATGARTVVRFNGGAQAAHNVIAPDGRHHTFSQLGSGSFVPGVRTILSRHVVVHPTALLVEASRLTAIGVGDAIERLAISADARVITPFHQAANRIRELARGDARHGSCVVGVGETVRDALEAPDDVVRAGHLHDLPRLRVLLRRARERLTAAVADEIARVRRLPEAREELAVLEDRLVVDAWIAAISGLRAEIVDDGAIDRRIAAPGAIVFEGAQGVLLDEWRGFHPYTTWSTCTFDNALELLAGKDREVVRTGVLRTYATRHGAGPFPTERRDLRLPERHNDHGAWQGGFRVGDLDLVLLRYAVEVCGGVDALAVTHLDALARAPDLRTCDAYHAPFAIDDRLVVRDGDIVRAIRPGPFADLAHQSALCDVLLRASPIRSSHGARGDAQLLRLLERTLGAPVSVAAYGPTSRDVRVLTSARSPRPEIAPIA